MDHKEVEKVATDQDLLMAVAGACRHSSPAVKAILVQREQAAAKKEAAAAEKAEHKSHR